jgi:hypothetical protein
MPCLGARHQQREGSLYVAECQHRIDNEYAKAISFVSRLEALSTAPDELRLATVAVAPVEPNRPFARSGG